MDTRFYNARDINIELLAKDLVRAFLSQGYQAQHMGDREQMLVQLKKGSELEALVGLNAALSLTIQRTSGGVMVMAGQQKWIDKAAVGMVGLVIPALWPLALTSGLGVFRQASLAEQVLTMVDGLVRQQNPDAQPGPAQNR